MFIYFNLSFHKLSINVFIFKNSKTISKNDIDNEVRFYDISITYDEATRSSGIYLIGYNSVWFRFYYIFFI